MYNVHVFISPSFSFQCCGKRVVFSSLCVASHHYSKCLAIAIMVPIRLSAKYNMEYMYITLSVCLLLSNNAEMPRWKVFSFVVVRCAMALVAVVEQAIEHSKTTLHFDRWRLRKIWPTFNSNQKNLLFIFLQRILATHLCCCLPLQPSHFVCHNLLLSFGFRLLLV